MNETPQSISVVTRDRIETRRAQSLGATLRYCSRRSAGLSAGLSAAPSGNLLDKRDVASCFSADYGCFHAEGCKAVAKLTCRWEGRGNGAICRVPPGGRPDLPPRLW